MIRDPRRVAVVTGAAGGIGYGFAECLRDNGFLPVIVDVDADRAGAAAERLGGRAVVTDVRDADAVAALRDEVVDAYGRVDLLCNNAGVTVMGPSTDLTLNDWRWVIEVNLWGVIHGVTAFLPALESNPDGGHIVNVASTAGLSPVGGSVPYSVSKSGVVAYSELLRDELAARGSGVGVTLVCPSVTRSTIHAAESRRPPELARDRPATDDMRRRLAEVERSNANGVEPRVLAEEIWQVVRDGTFWVLPWPQRTADRFNGRAAQISAAIHVIDG